jgi:UDP-N-acetylmuramyl tripeptide synthase
MLRAGDVLLVAGKGGEAYQEIMGIKYAFNDYDILKKLHAEKDGFSYLKNRTERK